MRLNCGVELPELLAAGRRHDAVHAQVYGDLTVVVEAMSHDDGSHAESRSFSFAEGTLDGFEQIAFIDGRYRFVGVRE